VFVLSGENIPPLPSRRWYRTKLLSTLFGLHCGYSNPTMDIAPEDGKKLGEQSSRTESGFPITVPLTTP